MTKKQMIKEIQELEANLFLQLKQKSKEFGENDSITKRVRIEWILMDTVMKKLNIKLDLNLPDAVLWFELVLGKYRN